jgi:hypothetical protein
MITPPAGLHEAAQRILESEGLRRSGRLRELLTYLLKRSAIAPDTSISEQDIGHEVYGRSRDYDTSHDTIVRVQIAQLRKKLERYYETEGARDELLLTIPKGRYQPTWVPRAPIEPVPVDPPRTVLLEPHRVARPDRIWATLCAILVIALAALVISWPRPAPWQNNSLRQSPAVANLWSEILSPDKPTSVVLSDPGLVMLANVSGRRVQFAELGDRAFMSRLESVSPSGEFRPFVRSVASSQLTALSDVEMVRRITALGISDPAMLNIVTARDFRIRDLNRSSSILIGYGVSNPWVEVFAQTINFVVDMNFATNERWITNLHPQKGEPARYQIGDPQQVNPVQGYSTVALLPNPAQSGKVLIVSATDVPGTEAAIRFLTAESLWEPFYRQVAPKGHLTSFEVVLAYRRLSNSSGDVSPIAWRLH